MRSHLDLELRKSLCPRQPEHTELERLDLLAFGPDSGQGHWFSPGRGDAGGGESD